jgi:hypothetical protein
MPVQSDHTALAVLPQAADLVGDAWTSEIVSRLPATFQTKAYELQVFQRARGLSSPSDLLRGLLAYALHGFSSRAWAAWAVLIGLATISERAWCGHLRRASPFLLWLLGELLAAELPATPLPTPSARRILLVDATRLPLIGGRGDAWRLHLAYDLLQARMAQLLVSDQTCAERLTHFEIQAGDIHVADSGYGYRVNLLHVVRAGGDVVLRIHPATCPLLCENGQPFDVLAWLKRSQGRLAAWSGYCNYRGQMIAVRLIASKVPPERAAKARKHKRREAKKAGRRIRPATLLFAGWWLLLTTLAAHDWPATEIVRLYQARWQIEIVFTQMTKGGGFPRRTGWYDVPDLNVAVSDDDTVDEQFNQLPALGEIQTLQGRMDALAEAADSFRHFHYIQLPLRLGIQLAQLLAQAVVRLLHLLSFALEFITADDFDQVGIQQPRLLALELRQRILEGLPTRLERLWQPFAHLRPLQFVGDQARLGQHLTQILPDQVIQRACWYVTRDTAFALDRPQGLRSATADIIVVAGM